MNRRRRQRLLLAALLAALVAAGARWLDVRLAGWRPVPHSDVVSADRSTTVYLLDDQRWTVFRIPATARRIRLLSHANVAASAALAGDDPIPYAIRYRLTTLGGAVAEEGVFEYETGLLDRIDDDGRLGRRAFYREAHVIPASLRRSHLDLETGEVLLLSLRAGAPTPLVRDVAVRVGYKHEVAERKLAYQWTRKSEQRRRQLAMSRVHGLTDLTEAERRSLLLTRWSPVGPQGVEGDDYRSRVFYYRDDLDALLPPVEEPGGLDEGDTLVCGPGLRVTFGLPEPGPVRLRFVAVPGEDGADDPAAPVAVRFFGSHLGERQWFQHHPEEDGDFRADLGAGLVEIESPVSRYRIEAFRIVLDEAGPAEVALGTSDGGGPSLVRAWLCGGDGNTAGDGGNPGPGPASVTFEVAGGHADDLVRVACRPPLGQGDAIIEFRWRDVSGAVVREWSGPVAPVPSRYDRVWTEGGVLEPVADPAEFVLPVPERASRLEVRASDGCLVRTHARPGGLVARTRVPEDYRRGVSDPERIPSWFPLWPPDADERVRDFRAPLLRLQERPPEEDADLLAGRFDWEDFDPPAGSLGHYLLADRDPGAPFRLEALPSLFMPVPVGGEGRGFVVPAVGPPGLEDLARRLAFVREASGPVEVRVVVGEETLCTETVTGSAGEFMLPPTPSGHRHPRMRVESDDSSLRAWVNHAEPGPGCRLKRFAHRFGPSRPLRFRVDKESAEAELLTATWFAPPSCTGAATIRITLEPSAAPASPRPWVTSEFTPLQREFVVRPGDGPPVDVLGASIPQVAEGRRIFVPLGRDVPPGPVEIAIEAAGLDAGEDGYLILSRVRGGAHDWARFHREEGS